MVVATVIDKEPIPGSDRYRVRGIMKFGYRESLKPADVRLNRIDFLDLAPASLSNVTPGGAGATGYVANTFAYPVGSVYLHGVVGSTSVSPPHQSLVQGAYSPNTGLGSNAILTWITGSSGTRTTVTVRFPGTVASGTRSAWFTVIGA